MANVVSWTEMNRRQSSGDPNKAGETWEFTVELDSIRNNFDIAQDIYGDSRCPTYFDKHPNDSTLFVVNRKAEQIEDAPQCFKLLVEYSNTWENDGQSQGQGNNNQFQWVQNPLQRPAVFQWDTYKTRKVFPKAYDSNDKLTVPVQTTAGEHLIIEEEVSYRIIHVTKNVTRVPLIFATEMDFINKDTVRLATGGNVVCAPKTIWLTNLRLSPLNIENGVAFYVVSYDLYINPEGWERKLRNQGMMEAELFRLPIPQRAPGPVRRFTNWMRRLTKIKLTNGETPSTPVPLVSQELINARIMDLVSKSGGPPVPGEAVRFKDAAGNYHVPAPESQAIGGLPATFWEHNMLTFRTRKLLKFTGNIPLR